MTNQVLPRRCICVRRHNAFTLIELVLVVGIILVLTGLVLSTVGYARKKGARARAETEIAAMSAACESYKADNGIYPKSNDTDSLDARRDGNPGSTPCPSPCPDPGARTAYTQTSLYLYTQLSGDLNANRQIDAGETGRPYFTFKPNMLVPSGGTGNVTAIADPFGNSYGYSTANQLDPT